MDILTKTHIGKRSTNQDYAERYYNKNNQLLVILCDGMGGHKAGDIASEMAVLQLGNQWEHTHFSSLDDAKEWLQNQINIENQRIYRVARSYADLDGMGTTMVTAAFVEDQILVANIGDSRAYQLTEAALNLVTVDHSFANELRISGEITEEEAKNHRQRHTLTRSLGVFDKVEVDFFIMEEKSTELLMLCSDGLSNGLDKDEIELFLRMNNPVEEKADKLIEQSLENGSTDNITVCIIKITNENNEFEQGEEENK